MIEFVSQQKSKSDPEEHNMYSNGVTVKLFKIQTRGLVPQFAVKPGMS